MVKNKSKKCYTLMEACVVMVIVSIFIALMANVVPHKAKKHVESDAHGHFECYWVGNTLYQRTFIEGNAAERQDVTSRGYCVFEAQKYIRFLILNAVGGGAKGVAGRFGSTFYNSSISSSYKIYPGKGGTSVGGNTVIKDSNNNDILVVSGGADIANPANMEIEDIESCSIVSIPPRHIDSSKTPCTANSETENCYNAYNNYYNCDKGPVCEVENGRIKVSYCRSNELYRTIYLPFKKAVNVDEEGNSYVEQSMSKYTQNQYVSSTNAYRANNDSTNYNTTWDKENGILRYCDSSILDDFNQPTGTWKATPNSNIDLACVSNNPAIPSLYQMTLKLKVFGADLKSQMSEYIEMLQYDADDEITDISPGDGNDSGSGNTGAVLILW